MFAARLIEPGSSPKRRAFSAALTPGEKRREETFGEVVARLKEIRNDSLLHFEELSEQLVSALATDPDVDVRVARNAAEAAGIVSEIARGATVAVNRSAVVANELMGFLAATGSRLVESYPDEFNSLGHVAPEAGLPGRERQERLSPDGSGRPSAPEHGALTFDSAFESFGNPIDLAALRSENLARNGVKDVVALIGVNAISAEHGAVVLLQHMQNVRRIFLEAKTIIFVVGMDKVVRSLDDAVHEAKCMGAFGSDRLQASLRELPRSPRTLEELPFLGDRGEGGKIHVILLDNDRSTLARSAYRDFFLCIRCGACDARCPAYLSGKPLVPSELLLNVKKYLPQIGPGLLEGDAEAFPLGDLPPRGGTIREEAVWACTTCGACQKACPLELRHLDAVRALRQNLVMVTATAAVASPLRAIERSGHPWGGPISRGEWMKNLDVELVGEGDPVDWLYWAGCSAALDPKSARAARATLRLLRRAGLRVGVLGARERCCGDPARVFGNEYLFRKQAEENISTLRACGAKKIVAGCPHCYHVLQNDYPLLGAKIEVFHSTEVLATLVGTEGFGFTDGADRVVSFHDPCYLARHHSLTDAPRKILNSIPGLRAVEMSDHGAEGLCCGGGGGRTWLEEGLGQRVNGMRIEQALHTGAPTLVTGCPYCRQMFEDAIKTRRVEGVLEVTDLSELLERCLAQGTAGKRSLL